ncbi:hypothetical protein D3C87_1767540 [compost metagenome]
MLEKQVGGMQRAKRGTRRNDLIIRAGILLDKRHHLLDHVIVKRLVPDSFVVAMHMWIQPAFGVDTVNAIHLHLTGINIRLDALDQPVPFIFQEIRCCRWDEQQRNSIVPVNGNFHFLVKRRTKPSGYMALHCLII